ncbi:DnaA ATPase domain-containing protein [Brevundimonas sp.]|uniref:DnaA ATPase domain-containing protein n=1 Tax=Brevundimonas sp. TaxID=1871086 RepID=UPI00289788A1|nr:DnaA/Hda family protein [Brevundimonas sp.]
MTAPGSDTLQLRLPLRQEAPQSAADFVVSESNSAAASVLSTWPEMAGSVLSIFGSSGSGKSHLAAAWVERTGAIALHGAEAALVDPRELEGQMVLLDRAQDADDESLFHLINLTQSGGGALLLVSRDPPGAWACELPDLRSRLNAIRTVALDAPDDAVLGAMLKRAFATRNITPGDEVIDYLARRIDRSADAVEHIVDRLDACHRPVTRVLARQVLGDSDELSD